MRTPIMIAICNGNQSLARVLEHALTLPPEEGFQLMVENAGDLCYTLATLLRPHVSLTVEVETDSIPARGCALLFTEDGGSLWRNGMPVFTFLEQNGTFTEIPNPR